MHIDCFTGMVCHSLRDYVFAIFYTSCRMWLNHCGTSSGLDRVSLGNFPFETWRQCERRHECGHLLRIHRIQLWNAESFAKDVRWSTGTPAPISSAFLCLVLLHGSGNLKLLKPKWCQLSQQKAWGNNATNTTHESINTVLSLNTLRCVVSKWRVGWRHLTPKQRMVYHNHHFVACVQTPIMISLPYIIYIYHEQWLGIFLNIYHLSVLTYVAISPFWHAFQLLGSIGTWRTASRWEAYNFSIQMELRRC